MTARAPVLTGCAIALLAPLLGCGGAEEARSDAGCSRKTLYGRSLEIRVVGKPIPCSKVSQIIRGSCRDGREWSCFSFHPPDPVLVWFKEKERWNEHYSSAIEARRYPCDQAKVTAAKWADAGRQRGSSFPTRRQVLADDVMRCRQLRGKSRADAIRLLGRPDQGFPYESKRTVYYSIGPERDSFIQIDGEALMITFRRDGAFKSAEIVQL